MGRRGGGELSEDYHTPNPKISSLSLCWVFPPLFVITAPALRALT